jgi:hypothetical protein
MLLSSVLSIFLSFTRYAVPIVNSCNVHVLYKKMFNNKFNIFCTTTLSLYIKHSSLQLGNCVCDNCFCSLTRHKEKRTRQDLILAMKHSNLHQYKINYTHKIVLHFAPLVAETGSLYSLTYAKSSSTLEFGQDRKVVFKKSCKQY